MAGFRPQGLTKIGPVRILATALLFCSSLGVNAQAVLDPSKLPSCAFNCQKLTQAQDACVPPAAPVTDQGTYQSCYCQSAYLTTLYSTPVGLCDSVCSSSDESKIQSWYLGLCHDGIVVTPAGSTPTASTTSAGASSTTTNGATAATQSPGSSSNPTVDSSSSNSGPPKSWIATHYGWVIFLIVLVLFLVVGIWLGLWLRRRSKRKATAQRFSSNSHLPGPGSTASPYDSGVLSHADASYMGSRNHPQMTMVPDAGSEAAFERYGGYGASGAGGAGSSRGVSASPRPATKGSRGLVKPKRTYS